MRFFPNLQVSAWAKVLVLAFFCSFPAQAEESTQTIPGTFDMQGSKGLTPQSLQGEWEFYWKELLKPKDYLARQDDDPKPLYAKAGQRFQEIDPQIPNDLGYGTYVLHVKNLTPGFWGMAGMSAYTSSRVYFFAEDGDRAEAPAIQVSGSVGKSLRTSQPLLANQGTPQVEVKSGKDYIILIQVSNFYHTWGGLWIAPSIARQDVLISEQRSIGESNAWLLGVMCFIAFYNFSLFMRRPEDRGSLHLTIFVLVVIVRIFFIGQETPFTSLSKTFNYEFIFKVIYASMILGTLAFLPFFRAYFPNLLPRRLDKILWSICAIPMLLIIILPVRHYAFLSSPIRFGSLALDCFVIFCMVRAQLQKQEGALSSLLGGICLLIGVCFDIAYTFGYTWIPYNSVGLGLAFFMAFQSQIVATRFASAFRQSERLGRDLQKEVFRQTRDIKSILRSIRQGIFTLVSPDKKVGPQYSKYLEEMTGQKQIAGRTLQDFLLDSSTLSAEQKDLLEACLESSFDEDLLNFEVNETNFVREISFNQPGESAPRLFELDWNPITDKSGRVDQILVSVRDVTEIRNLQKKANQQEDDLRMLIELVQIPEDKIQRFMIKTRHYLDECRSLVMDHPLFEAEVLRRLFVNMHTIKGAARTYFLHKIASASHDAEQFFVKLRTNPHAWVKDVLLLEISRVEDMLSLYEKIGETKLGWNFKEKSVKLERSTLEGILHSLQHIRLESLPSRDKEILVQAQESLLVACFVRLESIVDEAGRGLASIARDLQKLPPNVDIDAPPLVFREEGANAIFNCLIHLFRNSLDHGLEPPQERLERQKPEQGTIRIYTEVIPQGVRIYFSDDGRGLDLEMIQSKATSLGLLQPGIQREDIDIASLIFASGFSTRSESTEISGRGVGMDAVRSFLEGIGGRIFLELAAVHDRRRVSVIFVMDIPKRYCHFLNHTLPRVS